MPLKRHTLRGEQWIPRPIDEVFAFFADAHNLDKITPPWLNFEILSTDSNPIRAGSKIRYRLRWHGIPINWTTEIQCWEPPHVFVDVQRSGPYKLWRHTHSFEPWSGGTKIKDEVQYALPFGFVGRVVHTLKVRGDIESIFNYRRRRTQELFTEAR